MCTILVIIWPLYQFQVYNNFAFIVSEARNHGMQVFDLTQLRDIKPSDPIFNFEETAHYDEMGNTHNIVGNEDTGFMYAVGTSTCNSGLHMINVRDPLNPQFSGCFGDDGYVHDAQCVVYDGPDNAYTDHEICFCYNEDTLTVVDVSDKTDVKMLSRVPYNLAFYTHQGWLIEDQSHLLLNDELDELQGPDPNTRSMIWNVESLDRPVLIGSFYSKEQSTDHNLYIRYLSHPLSLFLSSSPSLPLSPFPSPSLPLIPSLSLSPPLPPSLS